MPPTVAGLVLGKFGSYIANLIVILAVTTTGGGEILAVTSIVINDIYSVYIQVSFKAYEKKFNIRVVNFLIEN